MMSDNHEAEDITVLKSFADDEYEPMVALKESINVQDLLNSDSNGGVEFEIDSENKDSNDCSLPEYHQEDIHKHLNMEAMGMDDDGESDDENNERSYDEPFERLSRTMDNLTEDGGVKKKILTEGFGNVVPLDMEVTVHYSAHLEFSDEPYDSTRLRGKPFKYLLGCGEMIEGMELAISTMRKNEESQFLIKPGYAFGKRGVPPRIPREATILIRIELLSWVEAGEMHKYFQMPREDRKVCDFKLLKKVANSFLEQGKERFKQGKTRAACTMFTKGIRAIEDYRSADEQVENEYHKLMIRLYQNNCVTNMKLNNLGAVKFNADKALYIDPKSIKALYFMGKAQRLSGDFDQAIRTLRKAQAIDSKNRAVNEELAIVNKNKAAVEFTYVNTCKRMFGYPTKKSDKTTQSKKATEAGKSTFTESKITDTFKERLKNQLDAFMEGDVMELPLSAVLFTTTEKEHIKKSAENLNLEFRELGEGSNQHIRLFKKRLEQIH